MKPILLCALFAATLSLHAADSAPATAQPKSTPPTAPLPPPLLMSPQFAGDPVQQLNDLVSKIQNKLNKGEDTAAALADEIKQFDDLLARHRGEKTDAVANILTSKAMLYIQILDDPEQALIYLKQVKTDFPTTQIAKQIDEVISGLTQQMVADKVSGALKVGVVFPAFADKDLKDLDGQPFTLDRYKGKVLLVDFWATWCEPCMIEMPNVIAAYKQYHDQGFEILGVSLDQDGAKDMLRSFLKDKGMPWPQFYDGKYWKNVLAVQYGLNSIPASFLLDGEGRIIAKNLRGEALSQAVAAALKSAALHPAAVVK